MHALVKSRPEKGFLLAEKAKPIPKYHEILIKISQAAICGTDMHIYHWDAWATQTVPLGTTIGHEHVGVAEAIGSDVDTIQSGDRVTGEGHLVCHGCHFCYQKNYHLCTKTKGVGIHQDGAFAEYLCIPAFNLGLACAYLCSLVYSVLVGSVLACLIIGVLVAGLVVGYKKDKKRFKKDR